ncbi:hypothetical protein Q8F55_008003 [Vanrija albida]|uniref:EF-hand domain-containing protein n=1 Tax=Vanrija albida TaxID=181172 RepID=A0ABR3PVC1_9TREE
MVRLPPSAPTHAQSKHAALGHGRPPAARAPAERIASGAAYTMFTPQQVKQFKEAFNMLDQDGDGRVGRGDLEVMLGQLGQTPTPALLDKLLASRPRGAAAAPGPTPDINFTQFLTMMGEHLIHLDHEHDLLEAFACFDDGDKGWVDTAEVRKHLAEMGDHMSSDEIDRLFNGPYTDRQGRFNYVEWAKVLRVNDGDDASDGALAI